MAEVYKIELTAKEVAALLQMLKEMRGEDNIIFDKENKTISLKWIEI